MRPHNIHWCMNRHQQYIHYLLRNVSTSNLEAMTAIKKKGIETNLNKDKECVQMLICFISKRKALITTIAVYVERILHGTIKPKICAVDTSKHIESDGIPVREPLHSCVEICEVAETCTSNKIKPRRHKRYVMPRP